MKKLTIVDIAKMAGVGTTTVSRYFNGGNLKKETYKKIKEIVDKYNYTPNTFAKALKSTDSKIIGVIVPCLHSYISGNTLKYLDKELKENNYETLIMNANFDENKQLEYIKKLARMNVDGIILLPTTMTKTYESTINIFIPCSFNFFKVFAVFSGIVFVLKLLIVPSISKKIAFILVIFILHLV